MFCLYTLRGAARSSNGRTALSRTGTQTRLLAAAWSTYRKQEFRGISGGEFESSVCAVALTSDAKYGPAPAVTDGATQQVSLFELKVRAVFGPPVRHGRFVGPG
jgi:hypothetical protein